MFSSLELNLSRKGRKCTAKKHRVTSGSVLMFFLYLVFKLALVVGKLQTVYCNLGFACPLNALFSMLLEKGVCFSQFTLMKSHEVTDYRGALSI